MFLTRGAVRGRWVGARWGRGRTHMPAVKTRLSTPSACAIVSSWCTCSVRDNCRVRAARGCVGVCTRVCGWHMEGGGASRLVEHRAQPIVQLPEARGQLLMRRGLRRRHEQKQKAQAVPAFLWLENLSFSQDIFALTKLRRGRLPFFAPSHGQVHPLEGQEAAALGEAWGAEEGLAGVLWVPAHAHTHTRTHNSTLQIASSLYNLSPAAFGKCSPPIPQSGGARPSVCMEATAVHLRAAPQAFPPTLRLCALTALWQLTPSPKS